MRFVVDPVLGGGGAVARSAFILTNDASAPVEQHQEFPVVEQNAVAGGSGDPVHEGSSG